MPAQPPGPATAKALTFSDGTTGVTH